MAGAVRRVAICISLIGSLSTCRDPGVDRAPRLRYVVRVDPAHAEVLVSLEIERVPKGGLSLAAFAPARIARFENVEARSRSGQVVPAQLGFDSTAGNTVRDVPRLTVRGPIPEDGLVIRYRALPGGAEGNAHEGYTGRVFGYLDGGFGLTTGRQLFLLPDPAERIRDIRVRFELPRGWRVVVPWKDTPEGFDPALEGRLAGEHLIGASIGLGRFHQTQFVVGATRYHVALESGLPPEEAQRVTSSLERLTRAVTDVFASPLGPDYWIVGVSKTRKGEEIVGESWGTGQGKTLVPLTPSRAQAFAADLIAAHMRHRPHRIEFDDSNDFWIVDAAENLYGWRAVATLGLIDERDVFPTLAENYLNHLHSKGFDRNLERVYAKNPRPPRPIREVLAPLVLGYLDHRIRVATQGREALDRSLRRVSSERSPNSLWAMLPREFRGTPSAEFRSRYVREGAVVPTGELFEFESTMPNPPTMPGDVRSRVTVVFTGKTDGYLENCGCKSNQSGGVARRRTVIDSLRRSEGSLLLLDAGSGFSRLRNSSPDFLAIEEQAIYNQLVSAMGYQAHAIGETELASGSAYLADQLRRNPMPYLTANIRSSGRTVAPSWRRWKARDVNVAVTAVIEPPRMSPGGATFEDRTTDLQIEDPVDALKRALEDEGDWADLIVVMGNLQPLTVRRLISACPEVDLVLTTEDRMPTPPDRIASHEHADVRALGHLATQEASGFLGETFVAYSTPARYGLTSLRLGITRTGRIAEARADIHLLTEAVRDDPAVRRTLDAFYDEVGRQEQAQGSVTPLFSDDPTRTGGSYVGAAACMSCHPAESAQWRTTAHATAFRTLLDRHRNYQPRCVVCHVVGFGTPTGYRLGAADERLANVQCETCHGPGGAHIASPAKGNIQGKVPEPVCLSCHDEEHSDSFVYGELLPLVSHSSGTPMATLPHGGSAMSSGTKSGRAGQRGAPSGR